MLKRVMNSTTEWTPVRFDQMATQVNERVDDPAEAGVEFYVGLEHLDPDSLLIRRWGEPTDVESTKLRFQPGDIIFGKRRVYQRKVAVARFEGICSAHAMVLRGKSDVVLSDFLPFFMQSNLFMERALSISVGSLSPTINWKVLAAEEFLVPPMQEQARLTELLAASQANMTAMISVEEAIEKLRRSIIYSFEDSLPEDQLGKMSDAVLRIEAGRSPPSNGEIAEPGELAVLKVSAVGDWEYRQDENKVIKVEDFLTSCEVRSGDFLVTRANADPESVARTCIVDQTRPGLMLSDKTWRVILTDEAKTVASGVLAWTKSRSFRKHIRNQLNGTDAKNVSQSGFLAGPFPSLGERFEKFDKQIQELNRRLSAVKQRARAAQRGHLNLINKVVVPDV